MGEFGPETLGAILFSIAGLFFLQKAARRNAVRKWGWGRTGEAAPLSRPSYALVGAMSIIIGVGISLSPHPNSLWVTLFFVFFVALGVSGFLDTRTERRRHSSRNHG